MRADTYLVAVWPRLRFRRFKWTTGSGSHSCRRSWLPDRLPAAAAEAEVRPETNVAIIGMRMDTHRHIQSQIQSHREREIRLSDSQTGWRDLEARSSKRYLVRVCVCGVIRFFFAASKALIFQFIYWSCVFSIPLSTIAIVWLADVSTYVVS